MVRCIHHKLVTLSVETNQQIKLCSSVCFSIIFYHLKIVPAGGSNTNIKEIKQPIRH